MVGAAGVKVILMLEELGQGVGGWGVGGGSPPALCQKLGAQS